MRRRSII
uniref:Uncharacterized protein n=1 Tax=Romanomermis culicivorax TaxID=13658 RepID=A0A915LDG2_ROMCU